MSEASTVHTPRRPPNISSNTDSATRIVSAAELLISELMNNYS